MRVVFLSAALIVLTLLFDPASQAGTPAAPEVRALLPDLVTSLLPQVVNISILKERPNSDGSMPSGADEMTPPIREVGSGFIIDPDGYVLTNRHVVAGAYKVTVVLTDQRAFDADVLSTNDRPDLALLKINAGFKLPAVKIGDSDALRMGETVIAIGNPLGLSSSVSVGVISALNRDLNETMIDDFIQTDAAINHGNSGGPLFNARGEVVGINTQLISPSDTGGSIGLGLAIPIKDAMFVAGEMRKYGRFESGYLGVRLQQLTPDIAAVVGLSDDSGGIVSAIFPGGPADTAGIREGDVMLQFGDTPTTDIRALLRQIGQTFPGTKVDIKLWRARQEQMVQATLTKWPAASGQDPAGQLAMPARGERMTSESLGMRVAQLTPEIAGQFDLPPTMQGVIVLGVAANSVGADVGFERGDVVLRINETTVATFDEIRNAVNAARETGEKKALVLVTNRSRPHWLTVPTDGQ